MSKRVGARARVRIIVDIPTRDRWYKDVTAEQVWEQARRSALGELRRGIRLGGVGADEGVLAQIVEDPIVTMVLVDEEA